MTRLALVLLLLLAGCVVPGPCKLTFDDHEGIYTGYAFSTKNVVSVVHGGAAIGQWGKIHTIRGKIPCRISAIDGDVVVLESEWQLQPGDSGSAVTKDCGCDCIVGTVFGRAGE